MEAVMKSYQQKDVARILDVNPKTVSFYVDQGFVTPEIDNPKGKGTKRKYSKLNLFDFAIIKLLSEKGVSLRLTPTILKSINGQLHGLLKSSAVNDRKQLSEFLFSDSFIEKHSIVLIICFNNKKPETNGPIIYAEVVPRLEQMRRAFNNFMDASSKRPEVEPIMITMIDLLSVLELLKDQ